MNSHWTVSQDFERSTFAEVVKEKMHLKVSISIKFQLDGEKMGWGCSSQNRPLTGIII